MKIKFIDNLINKFKRYSEQKKIRAKLKLRQGIDKTSKFKDMDFLK